MCLASLLAKGWNPRDELIVVDNGSTDGTREFLRDLAGLNSFVQIVLNAENRGFAAGNNQGLEMASGDVLILLNNDTLTPPGWRDALLRWLEDPAIGLVGPVTNRACNEAQVDAPYRSYGEMEQFARAYTQEHAGECGDLPMLAMFCLALRREVFKRIGPLDEQFEVGMFEDDDYARRVRQAGYRVVCAEDVFVHHFGQASLGDLCLTGDYNRILEANRRRFE
jgi:GT2 family glycosyltransferase